MNLLSGFFRARVNSMKKGKQALDRTKKTTEQVFRNYYTRNVPHLFEMILSIFHILRDESVALLSRTRQELRTTKFQ